jgi:hypothetical protein
MKLPYVGKRFLESGCFLDQVIHGWAYSTLRTQFAEAPNR